MNKNKSKEKMLWQQKIGILFFLVLGGICGLIITKFTEKFTDIDSEMFSIYLILILIFVCLSYFMQIIIHEAGHLIFGLLSGYKFSSFRIFNLMWIKPNGKIKLKKFSLAGTGGQCLMIPPEMQDGKFPVMLYNLGGSLMNIMVSIPFLLLYFLIDSSSFFSGIMLIFSVIGLISAAMNGIPMSLGLTGNDGYNAFSLRKNKDAIRSFWIQMKTTELLAKGKRLKDMPEEWFAAPDDQGMKNSTQAVLGVFACNRLMDEN